MTSCHGATVVRLFGGMGNQMFQYAFARHLAHLNNAPLFLDLTGFEVYKVRSFSLQHFALKSKVAKKWEVARVLGTSSRFSKLAFWRSCRIGMPSGNSEFKKRVFPRLEGKRQGF